MAEETIRVLRILEYTGPRSEVERVVSLSVHGEKRFGYPEVTLRAATIGLYPEVLDQAAPVEEAPNVYTPPAYAPAPQPPVDLDDEIPF